MPAQVRVGVVVTDASVLINFIHLDELSLFGRLERYDFLVPDEVLAEIRREEQRATLTEALERGDLQRVTMEELNAISVGAEFRQVMGRGEAACLALAATHGWVVACDERRVFRRQAKQRLGEGRLLTTAGIILTAIRDDLITIQQADTMKETLAAHRFRMPFESFEELL